MRRLFTLTVLWTAFHISLSAQNIEFVFFDGSDITELGSTFDNQAGSASYTLNSTILTAEAFLDNNSASNLLNGEPMALELIAKGQEITLKELIILMASKQSFFHSIQLAFLSP